MAHITGGGLPENLPRCLNQGQSISVKLDSWEIPPIFQWLAQVGDVSQEDMLETFNMGIGYVILVPPEQAVAALTFFESQQLAAYQIGKVTPGNGSLKKEKLFSDNFEERII